MREECLDHLLLSPENHVLWTWLETEALPKKSVGKLISVVARMRGYQVTVSSRIAQ
jgi:hypothetical protein